MKEQFSTDREVVLRVIDFLEKISTDYDSELGVFTIACHILGMLGDSAAIPSLINMLKKFGEIHSTHIAENMKKYDRYRIRVARFPLKAITDTLIKIGEEAAQPLTELLNSEHSETRKYAAYVLGVIGDRKAFPALKKTFNDSKETELVREVAGRALLQIDPEKAAEIVRAESLTPAEAPLSGGFDRIDLKMDLKVTNKHYSSLDDLGPLSKYKLSLSLYKYVREVIDFLYYMKYLKNWEEPFYPEIMELNLPQEIEIRDEIENIDEHFLPCLCGEYLEWAYVKSLSKRMWELDDYEGYHFQTDDVMCIYCKNCKRYTGIRRSFDDAHPEGPSYFYWFYLPRFPKQSELINEEELENKPPIWEERIDDEV